MAEPMRRWAAGTDDLAQDYNQRLMYLSQGAPVGGSGEESVGPFARERNIGSDPSTGQAGAAASMDHMTIDERAATILDGVTRAEDAVWREIEASVPKPKFFSYDYDRRTFEPLDDHRVLARGAILGSYWTEIIPGMGGDMSFAVPAVFEVDVEAHTVLAARGGAATSDILSAKASAAQGTESQTNARASSATAT